MIRGFAVLFSLQALGELLSQWLDLPLPGSVVGMMLMLAGLRFGLIQLEWVTDAASLLLNNLAMLFVPAGVGVMVYFDLIEQQWLPLLVATVISTLAVLAATGLTSKWLTKTGGCNDQ
ncbi:MAG: CidA/LrgA family protein [Deltaproteobacteria bacterium]|nr:CidA/LrgA family protein [Deltaproteobacteria bacterium]